MEFTTKHFRDFFHQVIKKMENEKEYLCQLDRQIGDGDHGVTMSIGWRAVAEQLNGELREEDDCGKLNIKVGKAFLNAVGSSVGPLYATGFMRGAKVIKGKTTIDEQDLIQYWIAFGDGVKERGGATVGCKTMIDTLDPFVSDLKMLHGGNETDFYASFEDAVLKAKIGMESTKDMLSTIGRSSRLGERSIGAQDPGATSSYFILETFLDYIKHVSVKQ